MFWTLQLYSHAECHLNFRLDFFHENPRYLSPKLNTYYAMEPRKTYLTHCFFIKNQFCIIDDLFINRYTQWHKFLCIQAGVSDAREPPHADQYIASTRLNCAAKAHMGMNMAITFLFHFLWRNRAFDSDKFLWLEIKIPKKFLLLSVSEWRRRKKE